MAEVRNNFIKSKMNKDLDDRLLSNGEYRDAQNVNVNRSEGEDVGALENVLGNKLVTDFSLGDTTNLEIIGYLSDSINNRVFLIATDYTDTSSDQLSNPAPFGASCYILMSDLTTGNNQVLVRGRFLNFSKTHPVFGIDLIEDLLFFSDNRNQPRKININKAISSIFYYQTEDQISVAKYYPYTAPYLYDTIVLPSVTTNGTVNCTAAAAIPDTVRIGMQILTPTSFAEVVSKPVFIVSIDYSTTGSTVGNFVVSQQLTAGTNDFTFIYPTSENRTDEFITFSRTAKFSNISSSGSNFDVTFTAPSSSESLIGNMLVSCPGKINEKVLTVGQQPGSATVTVDKNITTGDNSVVSGDILQFAYPNPNYENTWPGDKELLTDKFVRFAYRFKFDDGEYSLISPFTQPAFIPKQDGYIVSEPTNNDPQSYSDQAEGIGASTIISFFENKVDDVGINIEMPYKVNELNINLKIVEIDILYKESDGLAIQVLETIPVTDSSITSNSTTTYKYTYQSRKPFRTLPSAETTRVFDKVPIRSMSQSTSGNRLIYGNFIDKHSPPQNIDYAVSASPKYKVNSTDTIYSTVSTPNHTLKQNRTYQVGIVLADRYGRQSDVILSSLSSFQISQTGSSEKFDGSTVFHPYYSESSSISNAVPISTAHRGWFGDSLKILFKDKIPSVATGENAAGYPGLYKSGYYTAIVTSTVTNSDTAIVDSIDPDIAVGDIVGTTPPVSIISINQSTNALMFSGNITATGGKEIVIYGPENKLGWYSYKIVVKQQAQEYYNAYLANISSRPSIASYQATWTGTQGQSNVTQIQVTNAADISDMQIGDLVTGLNVTTQPGNALPATVTEKVNSTTFKINFGINMAASQILTITPPYISTSSDYVNNQSFYTTLISDNINKIPADLEEVQPEQTQFRTSDAVLYPRVTSLNIGGFPGSSQRHLGNNFATASTLGKISDLGIQAVRTDSNGDTVNVSPIASVGLFQAETNPTTAVLFADGITLGGKASDPFKFSYLEVKPADSLLDIFWETSTSGLISQLNIDIDAGPGTSPAIPNPPLSFPPVSSS